MGRDYRAKSKPACPRLRAKSGTEFGVPAKKRHVCRRFDDSTRFSRAGYAASPLHMVSGFSMIAHPPIVDHRLRGFIQPSGGFPETEDFCCRKRFSAIDARISEGPENFFRHKDCDFLFGKSKQPARLLGIESSGKMAKGKQFPPFLGLGSFDWICDSHLTKRKDVKLARGRHEAMPPVCSWRQSGSRSASCLLPPRSIPGEG
jgi:hypothetical protein